jgi:hypothetical protein
MWGLYALVLLGIVATVLAVGNERNVAEQLDTRAADDAALKVRAAFEEALGAVRGVDAIAIDGGVDLDAFQAFAQGAVNQSPFPALAYAQIVELDQREAFEAERGVTIRDTDGAGGLQPGQPRDPSFVVIDAYPRNETTNAVIGFDIAGDPVRERAARAALASTTPVLSDRTSTVTGARPGLSVVHAVRDRAGEPIGFVTSGLAIDELIGLAGVDVASLDGFALSMDGELLTGSATSGAAQTFEVAGRSFRVTVVDGGGVGLVIPLIVGLGTIALAIAVAWAAVRDRRQRSRLTRLSRRNRNIAKLGQRLAGSLGPSAVLDELALHAKTILDAQWSVVVRRSPDAPDGVAVVPPGASGPDWPGGPFPDVVRASIDSAEQVFRHHPMIDGAPLSITSGSRTDAVVDALSAPLVFSSGLCVGAVAFGWTRPLTAEQADDRATAATMIAELTSRAMERAVISDVVQERAQRLSALARTLASAHTSSDVKDAVAVDVAPLLGAAWAELASVESSNSEADRPGVLERAVNDAQGDEVGRLRLEWPASRVLNPIEEALLATVSDLIGQTLERTALSDQEHEVVVQFQHALLAELPTIAELDIASGYSPAMSVVGLGGDFYDAVVVDPNRTYIIVGDITGHGPEAVATMAELKSVIHHLLSSGTTPESTLEEMDVLLARRGVLATAQIVEIDTRRNVLRYVNAGHPYPVLRRRDGRTSLLTNGHRRMLGLGRSSAATPGQAPFAAGDLLLLYTDGLIERRTQAIVYSMNDLIDAVAEIDEPSLHDFIDRVRAIGSTDEGRVDDDIALIAVRRRPVGAPPADRVRLTSAPGSAQSARRDSNPQPSDP